MAMAFGFKRYGHDSLCITGKTTARPLFHMPLTTIHNLRYLGTTTQSTDNARPHVQNVFRRPLEAPIRRCVY